jgi:hypothetical protein
MSVIDRFGNDLRRVGATDLEDQLFLAADVDESVQSFPSAALSNSIGDASDTKVPDAHASELASRTATRSVLMLSAMPLLTTEKSTSGKEK